MSLRTTFRWSRSRRKRLGSLFLDFPRPVPNACLQSGTQPARPSSRCVGYSACCARMRSMKSPTADPARNRAGHRTGRPSTSIVRLSHTADPSWGPHRPRSECRSRGVPHRPGGTHQLKAARPRCCRQRRARLRRTRHCGSMFATMAPVRPHWSRGQARRLRNARARLLPSVVRCGRVPRPVAAIWWRLYFRPSSRRPRDRTTPCPYRRRG